ncbi:ribokinase [Sinomonas sp. P47F7]|uniref:ribokinase n=1 Tax=Sinomonas sp. P47F7 TaxID=3410987 RepID=UPI003BF55AC8
MTTTDDASRSHESPTADAGKATRKPLVAVVGSVNTDILLAVDALPLPGQTVLANSSTAQAGGKGANQAVAAARLGARVAFIGAVGQDPNASLALTGLREAGVDIGGVAVVPGETGMAFVAVDRNGENSIIVSRGANARVDRAMVLQHRDLLEDAAVLVLQGEVPAEAAAAAAQASPARLVLNLAPVIPLDPAVLRRADPLIVNEHEGRLALQMLGASGGEGPAADESVVAALVGQGIRSVVMTRGARGALLSQGTSLVSVEAPPVAAFDTTGAGDAFVGALSARIAAGDSLEDAVRLAVRVGAFAVLHSGAQSSYPYTTDRLPGGNS